MTLTRRHGMLVSVLAVAAFLSGCTGEPSRGDVLTSVGESTIVPMYERLENRAAALMNATDTVCASGGAGALADAHAALAATRAAWSETEAAWLGPVMDRRSWAVVDWPVNPTEIEELIANPALELDVELLGKAIGADQRGLGALEYMLGAPGADADPSAQFAARRCEFMVGVAQVIHDETLRVLVDWTTGAQDQRAYVDQLGQEGTPALDSLVNDALFMLEDIGDRELGAALGAMANDADVESIIEGPAGLATADIAAHLIGLRSVMLGNATDEGLRPLLGNALSDRLVQQLDAADAAVSAVGSPLRVEVVTNPAQVEALRQAVKDIQVTVATEVVSRLGVTIGFSDADGDTGA